MHQTKHLLSSVNVQVLILNIPFHIPLNSLNLLFVEYGTLRLSNVTEGYLEVYLDNSWGFVCEDFYYYYYYYYYYYSNSISDDDIADIACQQIGYARALSYNKEYYDPYYTYTANIVPSGCDQNTTTIANCSNSYQTAYCSSRWFLVCETGKFIRSNLRILFGNFGDSFPMLV